MTTTFVPSPILFTKIYGLWDALLPPLKSISNLSYFLVFQNFPAIRSGNSLGLRDGDEDLVITVLSVTWSNQKDDAQIRQSTQTLLRQIEELTMAAKSFRTYKHLNYAADWQDAIAGYGIRSKAYLQAVSRRYDPGGFFQTRVPGGFKVTNAKD